MSDRGATYCRTLDFIHEIGAIKKPGLNSAPARVGVRWTLRSKSDSQRLHAGQAGDQQTIGMALEGAHHQAGEQRFAQNQWQV